MGWAVVVNFRQVTVGRKSNLAEECPAISGVKMESERMG